MVSRKGLQLVNAARAAGAAFILGAAMSAAGTAAAQDPEP